MKQKTRSPKRTRSISVGGKAYVRFGKKRRMVRIIEDRGTIGRQGRRLLRVALTRPAGAAEQVFEVPADEVTRAQPRSTSSRKTKPKAA